MESQSTNHYLAFGPTNLLIDILFDDNHSIPRSGAKDIMVFYKASVDIWFIMISITREKDQSYATNTEGSLVMYPIHLSNDSKSI